MLNIFKPRKQPKGAHLTYVPSPRKSLEEIREYIAQKNQKEHNFALFPSSSIAEEDILILKEEGYQIETGALFGKEAFMITW